MRFLSPEGEAYGAGQFCMGGSPGDVSEELVTWENRMKGWRMSCDVGKVTEGLEE